MLSILGVGILKYVSPLVPISSTELVWKLGSADYTALIPWAIWLVIGIVAIVLARRKWIK